MCTALTLQTQDGYHLFGRNMDIEFSFSQSILLIPRNFNYTDNITGKTQKSKYAIIGMGTLLGTYPALADGLNEKGLACAGLNFPGYVHYEENVLEDKINLAPYDVIFWILNNFDSIEALKKELPHINIVKKPFNESTPLPTLHWIVVDKKGACIVIEKTKEKLSIYDNAIGVLSNAPTFDWHMTNLRQYINVDPHQPIATSWNNQELAPLGQGLGSFGLPGDFSTVSRFVRIAFLKSKMGNPINELNGISEFFHMLNNVSMVTGSVITPQEKNDITLYTSCMSQQKGVYYYTTYNNNRINAIDMNKEDLDGDQVKVFPYLDTQDINYQN